MNDDQLKKFRAADWKALQEELVRYAEKKVRRKKWRSGGFLPKGLEAPDLVAISITKTLNTILGEDEDEGKATWNEDVNPTLEAHLKDAIDSELANLVRSEEHKKTNYSAAVGSEEAHEIFEASVDAQNVTATDIDESVENKHFDEFKNAVMQELADDEDAQLLMLVYEELAEIQEVVKPSDAAEKMGLRVQEVYNLIKKLRRAADRVKQRMEEKYGK